MSDTIRERDLPKIFDGLKQRQFFGKVVIEFSRGQPKLMRTEETKLIEGETRNEHDTQR